MKTKSKAVRKRRTAPSLGQGVEAAVREVLRRLTPPEEARRHFASARLEMLKGFRALLDARIARRPRQARGESIDVE